MKLSSLANRRRRRIAYFIDFILVVDLPGSKNGIGIGLHDSATL